MLLEKFEVINYKGFKEHFEFNLSTNKKYSFNKDMIEHKIIKKALIYGPNGSGKTSLSLALIDITFHLTDREKVEIPNVLYFYAGTDNPKATFSYTFSFGKKQVRYEYCKLSQFTLAYEKLYVNDECILKYDYFDESNIVNLIPEAKNLNLKGLPPQLSAIKYIGNNTNLSEKSPIKELLKYVNGMLYFKGLSDRNFYIGYKTGSESLSSIIINNNKIDEFNNFLKKFGLNYDLTTYQNNLGFTDLGIKFENGKIVPFDLITSSGTKTIWLFYCWMLEFNHLSMLIIDEFDAFYQHYTAHTILNIINQATNLQSVITTHNLTLMDNETTRPDCCFLMKDRKIAPIYSLTKKEIRESNNLEKMYKDGQFTNWSLSS